VLLRSIPKAIARVLFTTIFCALTGTLAAETVALDKEQLRALINELVDQRVRELGLERKDLDERIVNGVEAYIQQLQQSQADTEKDKAALARVVSSGEHVYGNPKAVFSLIEYSDFECPYCKRFHSTPRELVDRYPDRLNWVYRHLPLSFHNPGAQKQAEASECAAELGGNKAFWRFTDLLYARTKTGGRGFALENLPDLAVEVGIEKSDFVECYNSGRHRKRVESDAADARRASITGTPGTVLRHNPSRQSRALGGALPAGKLLESLQELAREAGEPDF